MAYKKLTGEQHDPHSFDTEKVLEGVLVDKRENVGANNSKLFTIEKKGGKKVSVWGSAVLDKIYQVQVGSMIKITYLGKAKGKAGREFRNYDIEVDDSTVEQSKNDIDEFFDDIEKDLKK